MEYSAFGITLVLIGIFLELRDIKKILDAGSGGRKDEQPKD